ncbi:MAG: hypothetical protein PWP46_1671 [Fusobacteriaceae bacterium]|nr:hypothetical protein [Fusobacteriaceae bacterium]
MRKENSKFITKFITSEGDRDKNRDYFAYVELDDYACWVLADGLDSDEERLSAEIVVGSIIEDFTENPKMDKRTLKRYLKTANEILLKESRTNILKSSVVVILSNYNSIIYGNVGNTRLYHFRKNQLLYKTKDQSVSSLLASIGKIDEVMINQHEERNNLVEFLGKEKGVKINISKKPIELKEGDFLLLSTSGYWENMKDIEIEDIVKESEDSEDVLVNLENIMLEKDNPEINNYTIVSISIQKIFIENVKKTILTKKNILVASVIGILLIGGVAIYNNYKKIEKMKLVKIQQEKLRLEKLEKEKAELAKKKKEAEEKLKNSLSHEENGDNYLKERDFVNAKESYNKALDMYKLLMKKDAQSRIEEKIKKVEKLEEAYILIENGDNYLVSEDFVNAKINYIKAKEILSSIENEDITSIDKKIVETEATRLGKEYEKTGDIYYTNETYDKSIENYNLAKDNYVKIENYNLKEINNKLENAKIMNKGKISEDLADELFTKQEYHNAITKYEQALQNYKLIKNSNKVNGVNSKIDISKKILDTINIEDEGDKLVNSGDLDGGKAKYEIARASYKGLGLTLKENDIKDKLVKLNIELLKLQKLKNATSIENEGDNLYSSKNFEEAKNRYEEAKDIYQELKTFEKVEAINQKLEKVSNEEDYAKAKSYEETGDELFKQKKYDDAIANYEIAKTSYLTLKKTKDYLSIDEKIKKAKKKKKIFGIF